MAKRTKSTTQTFDISEHSFVPKHELLTDEEAETLLRRLDVSRQQLPYILANDPIVKKLGAKVGDVIRITRDSETAGKTVYYRVVWREV